MKYYVFNKIEAFLTPTFYTQVLYDFSRYTDDGVGRKAFIFIEYIL